MWIHGKTDLERLTWNRLEKHVFMSFVWESLRSCWHWQGQTMCQALEFLRRWCSEESTLLGLRVGRNCAWATILMLHQSGQHDQSIHSCFLPAKRQGEHIYKCRSSPLYENHCIKHGIKKHSKFKAWNMFSCNLTKGHCGLRQWITRVSQHVWASSSLHLWGLLQMILGTGF